MQKKKCKTLLAVLRFHCAVKKALEAGWRVRVLKLALAAYSEVMPRNLRLEPVSRFVKARIARLTWFDAGG